MCREMKKIEKLKSAWKIKECEEIIGLDPIIFPAITENILEFSKYKSLILGKIAVSSTAMTHGFKISI